jgi:4'-phosphopantetheinyl transferase
MPIDESNRFTPQDVTPPLVAGEVHVWLLACAGARPAAVAGAARDALHRLLADYAGVDRVPGIARGEHGKPFAPEWPDLHFNLSHSGRHVLLAFARDQPLGIDIERRDRRVSHIAIAQRFFTPDEAQAIADLAADRRADAFRHLWTYKEAVLKALGAGLSFGLDRVEFEVRGDGAVGALRRLHDVAGQPADWIVQRLAPAPELVGALAWCGPPRRLRTFEMAAALTRRSPAHVRLE